MMASSNPRAGMVSMFAVAFCVAAVPAALYLTSNPPHMPKAAPVVKFQSWNPHDSRPSVWIMGAVPPERWREVHDALAPAYGTLYEVQ